MLGLASLTAAVGFAQYEQSAPSPAVVKEEFIYDEPPTPQCHASTIAETKAGLVTAWFGGTHEKHPDVGIWLSRFDGEKWSEPVEVANGVESKENRYPCWNPVLFQPEKGPLLLFYKVGPSPSTWWGMLKTSDDGGAAWSEARRLPEGILGPIKNKPIMIDGVLLCGSSTEHDGWRLHFERSTDLGKTWQSTGPIHDGRTFAAIQPTLLTLDDGSILALCRSRQGKIVQTVSRDGGKTWSELIAAELPNPNAGIDGVTLDDGRHLLVYNHTPRGRSPLNVAISKDGRSWKPLVVLEDQPGEYSYPAVIQPSDGKVHITYTWKRTRVKHVVLDPAKLNTGD
ncbi:MAG: exo-alpha-sialidase [Planctomycetes bacterium]|nr:exo-alpha-sialidase [Planctomycetota bacterium]